MFFADSRPLFSQFSEGRFFYFMDVKSNSVRIKRLTAVAMFCALSYACMLAIKIPVQFLTLDIKDSLIILCSLLFGPLQGLAIAITVPLLEFITISETGVYGLIMNALSSVTFCLVTGLIYRYKKSIFGAIIGLLSGIFAVTAVMVLANLLITPHFLGVSVDAVAGMLPSLLLPFNLIKAVLNAAIVLLLYKPLSNVLKRIGFIQGKDGNTGERHSGGRSALVTAIAVCLIVASLLIIFLVLR